MGLKAGAEKGQEEKAVALDCVLWAHWVKFLVVLYFNKNRVKTLNVENEYARLTPTLKFNNPFYHLAKNQFQLFVVSLRGETDAEMMTT